MPQLQVTTKTAEKVWSSPDGQRVIQKLTLDYNGQEVTAKTYSKAIAKPGWTGTVETYEKAGNNGVETFVKQPQSDANPYGGSAPSGATKPNYGKPQDNYTMYLSYVKDIAVALINSDKYSVEQLNTIASDVADVGEAFYDVRPDNKETGNVVEKTAVDKVFGQSDVLSEEDIPWNPETDEEIPIVEDVDEPPQLPVK